MNGSSGSSLTAKSRQPALNSTPNSRCSSRKASRFTTLRDDEVEVEVVVPVVNIRRLISRYDRTSRPLHRGPRGSLSGVRRREVGSACAVCFVSAQPERDDQTEMKITNPRAGTALISISVRLTAIGRADHLSQAP